MESVTDACVRMIVCHVLHVLQSMNVVTKRGVNVSFVNASSWEKHSLVPLMKIKMRERISMTLIVLSAKKEEVGLLPLYYIILCHTSSYRSNVFSYLLCNVVDLICCDGCTKVYHPACHKPKIHDLSALPEEWYCMHCCETKKESMAISKQKNKKYTGTLIADMGHCDLKCTVRFPKIECIVCEEQEGESIRMLCIPSQ